MVFQISQNPHKSVKLRAENIQKIVDENLPVQGGPFTENELHSVLKSMKNRKSAGLDGIPPEVWKTGMFNDAMMCIINKTLTLGEKAVFFPSRKREIWAFLLTIGVLSSLQ